MNVGFIGTGSMGGILIEALIHSESLTPDQITASNRTYAKVEALADRYPGLLPARSNLEVILRCAIVFICVKPGEYKRVLDEIKHAVNPSQIVVSITSPVLIRHLEDNLNCKIAKVIPSITNFACSGATLCMYSHRMTPADQVLVEDLLGKISTPIRVEEEHTRVTSDISSCGPAFLSFFLERFIQAAVDMTGIDEERATKLASEMLLGTGQLLTSKGFDPSELRARVSVPGGITEAAIQMMDGELNGVFENLIRITHAKYEEDLEKLDSLLSIPTSTKPNC